MTHPSVPAKNLKEFFEPLKADPKKYTIATTGLGSAGHLTVEFLKLQAKVEVPTLPYRGAGPALNDLVGGHIHLLADPMLSALPNVKAGKLKALAVTTAKRTPLAPDVPTVAGERHAAVRDGVVVCRVGAEGPGRRRDVVSRQAHRRCRELRRLQGQAGAARLRGRSIATRPTFAPTSSTR